MELQIKDSRLKDWMKYWKNFIQNFLENLDLTPDWILNHF